MSSMKLLNKKWTHNHLLAVQQSSNVCWSSIRLLDYFIRVFQMDFTMAYECEYQNEVKSALWTCLTVNLLTAACFFDSKTQTFLICTDSESGLAG